MWFPLLIWNKSKNQSTLRCMYLRVETVYHEKELEYTVMINRKEKMIENSKSRVSFENVEL